VGGRGEQVGDHPVGAHSAADGLAVHRDPRQPPGRGEGKDHRTQPGPAGQEHPGVIGQPLGAQVGEHPPDRLGVRRGEHPRSVAAASQRSQHSGIGAADPGGDVLEAGAPAQHRCGAHRQDGGQPVADPAAGTRIDNRGKAAQQITAAGGVQTHRVRDQLLHRGLRRWRGHCGHAKLARQRSLRDK